MLYDFFILHAIQVKVDTWFGFVCSCCGDKDKVALSNQQMDFIDSAVLHKNRKIVKKLRDSVTHTRLMTNYQVSRKVSFILAVIAANVKRFVLGAQQ